MTFFLCFVINKPSRNISEHKMAAFMLRSPDEEIKASLLREPTVKTFL